MGRGRPHDLGVGPPPGGRRVQIGPREPTLERAFRGDETLGGLFEQLHPDQSRPPGGVLAAQAHSGLHDVRRYGGGPAISGREAFGTLPAEALEEPIDRRAC
jgi:hypothetical protein